MNCALRIMLGLMLEFCVSNVFGMELVSPKDLVHRKRSISSILQQERPVIEVSKDPKIKDLYSAVISRNKNSLEALIKNGIDINQVITSLGETPLYIASALGYEEVVAGLLKLGADKDKPNIYGWTPLHAAAFKGKIAIVRLLLDARVAFDLKDMEEESTPLIFAAYNGYREIVRMLLEAGANSNATDYCNKTALYWAVFNNDIEMARILIASGSGVNKTEVSGKTPLHIAVFRANFEIVMMLLNAGAQVNIPDRNGDTPLKMALEYGNKECVEILVANYFKNNIKVPEDLIPGLEKVGIDISIKVDLFAS